MDEFLQNLQRRPAMYWLEHRHPFTSFVAFAAGLSLGAERGAHPEALSHIPTELVPPDFNQFVTEHFGLHYPVRGHGWFSLIRERTTSEQEAFALLFTLLDAYEQRHPRA